MKKVNDSHPELKNANATNEVAMLAGLPGELSEIPDFSAIAQTAYESIIT